MLVAAERLAREVRWNIEEEEKRRKIHAPRPLSLQGQLSLDSAAGRATRIELTREQNSILTVYRSIPSGRLVILGIPGAGKTVLVQRLALEYLSERQRYGVFPVCFNLKSWNPLICTLENWMVGQLLRDHTFLTRAMAGESVKEHCVLPFLDGFDELSDGLRLICSRGLCEHAAESVALAPGSCPDVIPLSGRPLGAAGRQPRSRVVGDRHLSSPIQAHACGLAAVWDILLVPGWIDVIRDARMVSGSIHARP